MRNRERLEENLTNVLEQVKLSRRTVNEIQRAMLKNKIPSGDVQNLINGKTPLDEVDERILCLLTINVYDIVKKEGLDINVSSVNYTEYFSDVEVKLAKTYEEIDEESITLPYTFKNVIRVNPDHYICVVSAQELKKLFDSGLLFYNFDTQREHRVVRDKKDPKKIIQTPKINTKAVREISDHMKNGTLISSTLTLNVRLGTADNGEELIYNEKDSTLEVIDGIIDVLDGFHRLSAIISTLSAFPDVDMNFTVNIVNYGVRQAQNYFAQLNSATPVSTSRLMEMKQSRQSDFVVRQIRANSEYMGDKISSSEHISSLQGHVVSFKVLSDAIDEVYNIENRAEALKVAKYLTKFFDQLFINNYEAFISETETVRKESLINANQFFYGWITLAKRMQDSNIDLSKLQDIVNSVDFQRNNPLWAEIGILDSDKNINRKIKNQVKKFFNELELDEVSVNV